MKYVSLVFDWLLMEEVDLVVIIASSLSPMKSQRTAREGERERTFGRVFMTYLFEFHIVNRHNPRSRNSTVDCCDPFDKFRDCIDNSNKDHLRLKKKQNANESVKFN